MTGAQKAIIFLHNFGTGLFVPILSLFMLYHGCDLQSLALVIGLYSATVIIAEVPSGMFADVRGRKNAYYLSCAFVTVSLILMYFAQGVPVLAAGMALFGLGRAFLSGSLDSLIMEDCMRRHGDFALSRIAGENLVYQCGGIAAGALLGGLLPNIHGYLPHITVRLAVLCAVSVLCAKFLREEPIPKAAHRTLKDQTRMVATALKGKRLLRIVLFVILGGSTTMFALETYWQPQFAALISGRQHYLLGILCAGGYGANMLGSFFVSRIKMRRQKDRWRLYLLFIVLLGLALCTLAVQKSAAGFMALYVLTLAMLGAANVPEQTLLNSLATDETRASLLSVASLSSQMGGIFSSAVCAILVVPVQIAGVLLVMGGFTVTAALAAVILLTFRGKSAG